MIWLKNAFLSLRRQAAKLSLVLAKHLALVFSPANVTLLRQWIFRVHCLQVYDVQQFRPAVLPSVASQLSYSFKRWNSCLTRPRSAVPTGALSVSQTEGRTLPPWKR